jgi:ketosteroid isomerase-like protein
MSAEQDIQGIVDRINGVTLGNAREDISQHFHEDVTFVSPDFKHRAHGRDKCLASYEEFRRTAELHEYELGKAEVKIEGTVAIADYPFEMRYTYGGDTSHETGRDILVFTQQNGAWVVIWRTLVTLSQTSESKKSGA